MPELQTKRKKPTILISSTVYGIEELLERIYTILTVFGYEVLYKSIMSDKVDFKALELFEDLDIYKLEEDKTKIAYESWHWRYVGEENAKRMNELNMCLEEYVEYLQNGNK